uniref:Origin recognition complex subunit 6 n=1 Tax=Glycine max TaxID=3847 RepID=A0A0R0L238_SOYBN
MDVSELAKKLGLSDSKLLVRKAAELRRLCDVQFDSSVIGVGEVAKSLICLEIAATRLGVLFDRSSAVRLSGMSERAYIRSYNSLHNGLGVKMKLDVRELAIQFGCVRIIPFVRDGLKLYKDRFVSSLPASRRASADFTRPVFTAVAFYLCAKKHKVSATMKDLCHDVFGVAKEKKDPKEVQSNRDLLDVLPSKRKAEDGGYSSEDGPELSSYKKAKKMEKHDYEKWKSSVLSSNKQNKKAPCKRTRQTSLNFLKEPSDNQELEAI